MNVSRETLPERVGEMSDKMGTYRENCRTASDNLLCGERDAEMAMLRSCARQIASLANDTERPPMSIASEIARVSAEMVGWAERLEILEHEIAERASRAEIGRNIAKAFARVADGERLTDVLPWRT